MIRDEAIYVRAGWFKRIATLAMLAIIASVILAPRALANPPEGK